jgi:intracellular multiplication protein IcmO
MMAAGLGDSVEGTYADLVERKPTNADTPFLCILDEYGYYAVEGFAVVPAQARSLGFSVVFAGQDLPAFQKASKEEAASIGANTNIKICMKLEDPTETWDFFMKGAGESYVTHVDSFQVDQGSVLGTYADAKGAKIEKRARIDLLDLKEQMPGEAHFFFKSKIVRGRFFSAAPKPVAKMRLNHFLKIDAIEDSKAMGLIESFNAFKDISQIDGELLTPLIKPDEELASVLSQWQANENVMPIDRAILTMQQYNLQPELPDFFEEFVPEVAADHLNIFTPLREGEHVSDVVVTSDYDIFKKPILDRSYTRDQIEYMGRLMGQSGQKSMNVAIEVIGDMEKGTHYPPAERPVYNASDLSNKIDAIIEKVHLKQQQRDTDSE